MLTVKKIVNKVEVVTMCEPLVLEQQKSCEDLPFFVDESYVIMGACGEPDGDSDDNLWSTFNVVQEKLIRGGFIKQQGRNSRSVKGINSLNMDNMINTRLWELAETFC